ncbi:MAG: HEAT repeat domain-containing protein [Planctomycetes bacterium]|nr:HEAT repeat domain-containing protein [Planctomycetota bacterium]
MGRRRSGLLWILSLPLALTALLFVRAPFNPQRGHDGRPSVLDPRPEAPVERIAPAPTPPVGSVQQEPDLAAVLRIARQPRPEAFDLLADRFHRSSRADRLTLLDGLRASPDPRATTLLLDQLVSSRERDEEYTPAVAVALGLRDRDDPLLTTHIVQALRETSCDSDRTAIIGALGHRQGTSESFDALTGVISNTQEPSRVRCAALLALTQAHPDQAREIVQAVAVSEPDAQVRGTAEHVVSTDIGRNILPPQGCMDRSER